MKANVVCACWQSMLKSFGSSTSHGKGPARRWLSLQAMARTPNSMTLRSSICGQDTATGGAWNWERQPTRPATLFPVSWSSWCMHCIQDRSHEERMKLELSLYPLRSVPLGTTRMKVRFVCACWRSMLKSFGISNSYGKAYEIGAFALSTSLCPTWHHAHESPFRLCVLTKHAQIFRHF